MSLFSSNKSQNGGLKLVIVDDNEIVYLGIKTRLSALRPELQFAYYSSLSHLVENIDLIYIKSVLLLDVFYLGGSINELYETYSFIRKRRKDLKIIAMSSQYRPEIVRNAMKLGASGFYIKADDTQDLLEGIGKVIKGEKYFSLSLHRQFLKEDGLGKGNSDISKREIEVIEKIAEGLNNFEIAEKLFISVYTVQNHRQNILQKLDAKNTADLIRIAVSKGLINY